MEKQSVSGGVADQAAAPMMPALIKRPRAGKGLLNVGKQSLGGELLIIIQRGAK